MKNCPYCGTSSDEAYNFCVSCEQQVKCLKCGGYLLKDKAKCLVCGTLLVNSQNIHAPLNTFTLEENQSEKTYSRTINLAFTDNAVDKVAPVLTGHVPLARPREWSQSPVGNLRPALPPFQSIQEEPATPDEEKNVGTPAQLSAPEPTPASDDPNQFFKKDSEGYFISTSPDYKGKSKKVQQERFSLLYVWAYNLVNGEAMPNREHLTEAAKRNGIHNKNYTIYLTNIANKFFIKSDGTYKLNPKRISLIPMDSFR